MQWLEEDIRPRKSKSNVLSQEDVPEKFGDCEDSELDQDEPLPIIAKSQSKQKLETQKPLAKQIDVAVAKEHARMRALRMRK